MVESRVLGKSYKTKAAYKTQINRYKKQVEWELKLRTDAKKKGWKEYLGDPISRQISSLELELLRVEKEIKKILL